ncbi:TPA: hypothetical protein ACSP88_004061 [Aeromonas hydrophila]
MNIKMSAISASVLLMLAGGVMAAEESFEIQYKGEVTTDTCILTGNGNGLIFELQPVLVSTLQNASSPVNFLDKRDFAKVVCEGNMKSVTVAWDSSIPTKLSSFKDFHALIPENIGDTAEGTYIYTWFSAKAVSGAGSRLPNDSTPVVLAMTSNDDGYMESPIALKAGYITAKDDKGVFETVTPGSVLASAPLVLSYQ